MKGLTPEQYLKIATLGFSFEPLPRIGNLCGRIIRGKTEADLEKLSDDPNRLVVFLTDSIGLAKMIGKTGYEMLITVGHHPDHISKQLGAGKKYRFVVFPSTSAQLADWAGLFTVMSEVYPDIKSDVVKHAAKIISDSSKGGNNGLSLFEKELGFKLADVDDPSNPKFMSYDAYLKSPRSCIDLRRLMYHTLHIRELFRGDGYTYDEQGRRGVKEYLMPNKKVLDIPGVAFQDLDVQLP